MFAKRLKELRREKGKTQKDLANAIGVGRTTICEYENGNIVPKQEGLLKIANYFNVSVDYLTGVSNDPVLQNVSKLDDLLNMMHSVILNKDDTKVTYRGKELSLTQKLIVDQYIEQLKDNIEIMLQHNV